MMDITDITRNINIDIAVILDRQKLIIPIITLLITLIISHNLYKAQKLKINSLRQQIKEEEKLNELIKVIKVQEEEFSGYEKTFGIKDASLIMKEVSEFAAASGVKILSFNPLETIISEILEIIPLNLNIEGSYHDIGDFIGKIESSKDILNIVNFELSESDSAREGGREKKESLNTDMVINAIFLAE